MSCSTNSFCFNILQLGFMVCDELLFSSGAHLMLFQSFIRVFAATAMEHAALVKDRHRS